MPYMKDTGSSITPTAVRTDAVSGEYDDSLPDEISSSDHFLESPKQTRGLNTWIELSYGNYRKNLSFLRRRVGADVELSAVVKADAYGHGLLQVATMAMAAGADSFCVHSLDEALNLRRADFHEDILIMGHVPLARLSEVVRHGFRMVAYNIETLDALADLESEAQDGPVRLHLKLETGTHRQGIDGEVLDAFLDRLRSIPWVSLEGVYTHFANIEDTTDHQYARGQLQRFQELLDVIEKAGFSPTKRHSACSAAAILFPETHFDFVRVGISQYGFWSSRETLLSYELGAENRDEAALSLRPVLTWKTRLSQVKWVQAGASVGYGCSYKTTRRSRIGILPIGYSDGYDRGWSSASHVLVRGCRAPVCGRICMNLVMVDLTDVPGAALEDEVVLIGSQGDWEVSADELAGLIGTIHYEVVARLSRDIRRVIVAD